MVLFALIMGLFHFDFVSGSAVWDAMAHQRWPGQEDGGGLLIHHPPSFDPRAGWASTRGRGGHLLGSVQKTGLCPILISEPPLWNLSKMMTTTMMMLVVKFIKSILQVAHTREPSVLSMGGQTHRKAFVERFELGLSSYGRLSSSSICRCLTTATTVKGLDHLVRPERKATSQKPGCYH